MFAHVLQKKGDPGHLDGRITVYGLIDMDPADLMSVKHTFASMVHNGLLVAQGNFKDQYNFRDFLKSELGISLEEGLEEGLAQFIERMDGLEATLDPQKLKERLENMNDLEDFIPTPAKIVPFHSEAETLAQEGDVYCVGSFKNIGNAVLAVQALPMLYQSLYREQEVGRIRSEIEAIISQIERSDTGETAKAAKSEGVSEDVLLKEYIPAMLYSRREPRAFKEAEREFRQFLAHYRFPDDVDAVVSLIRAGADLSERENRLIELYAKKIVCVAKEDFKELKSINREIQRLSGKT
jgi:hypothetical protein